MLTHLLIAQGLAFSTTCAVGLKKTPRRQRAICPKLRRQISVFLPAYSGQCSGEYPSNTEGKMPCHGQLRHLWKCASASKSTATCRPTATYHPSSSSCCWPRSGCEIQFLRDAGHSHPM